MMSGQAAERLALLPPSRPRNQREVAIGGRSKAII